MANESQVAIINMALGHLGDSGKLKRMTTFSRDGCTNAVLHAAYDFYTEAKKEMHAVMDWQRTRKIVALTQSSDDPILDEKWTYKYVRPADCLILRKVIDEQGNSYAYDEVNEISSAQANLNDEYIYTNVDDAIAWYTILIGEERYLPGMARLHAMFLARDLTMQATGNVKLLVTFDQMQEKIRQYCMALGATEGYVEQEDGERTVTDCY